MRRAVLLVAALLALAACGHTEQGRAVATTTASQSRSPQHVVFDRYVQQQGLTSHGSLSNLHAEAQAICRAYGDGLSFLDVIGTLTQNGWSGYEAGEMNGASVAAFCPQYSDEAQVS